MTKLNNQIFYYVLSTQPIAPELRKLTRENSTFFPFSWPKETLCSREMVSEHSALQHVFYIFSFSHTHSCWSASQKKKKPKQPNKSINPDSPLARMTRNKNRCTHLYPSCSPGSSSFFQARHKWLKTIFKDLLTKGLGQLETTLTYHHGRRQWYTATTPQIFGYSWLGFPLGKQKLTAEIHSVPSTVQQFSQWWGQWFSTGLASAWPGATASPPPPETTLSFWCLGPAIRTCSKG